MSKWKYSKRRLAEIDRALADLAERERHFAEALDRNRLTREQDAEWSRLWAERDRLEAERVRCWSMVNRRAGRHAFGPLASG